MRTAFFIFGFLALGIIISVGIYVYNFWPSELSNSNADWGTFGDYLTGTAGIVVACLAGYIVYLGMLQQDLQRAETTFQGLSSNYHSLIGSIRQDNLIGRELFDDTIGRIEIIDYHNSFQMLYSLRSNVFAS